MSIRDIQVALAAIVRMKVMGCGNPSNAAGLQDLVAMKTGDAWATVFDQKNLPTAEKRVVQGKWKKPKKS